MLNPSLQIVLPCAVERLAQLHLKLAEYWQRIQKSNDPGNWMRFDLLSLLISLKALTFGEFRARQMVFFERPGLSREQYRRLCEDAEAVWKVVSDYCQTGGVHVSKRLPTVRRPIPGEGFAVSGFRAVLTSDYFGSYNTAEIVLGDRGGLAIFHSPITIPAFTVGRAIATTMEPDGCLIAFPIPAIEASEEQELASADWSSFLVEVRVPAAQTFLEIPE